MEINLINIIRTGVLMKTSRLKNTALAVTLLGLATPALAHTGMGATHDFVAGLAHPWQGFDHLLVMFAIGLWGCMLAGKLVWQLPLSFLMLMSAGAGLHFAGFTLSFTEQGVALSVIIFAIITVFNLRASAVMAISLVSAFAVCHGYAHASEIATGADQLGYTSGFLLSTAILHSLGISTGLLSIKIAEKIQLKPATHHSMFYSLLRRLPTQHINN
jgi:urease accessory protein